MAVFPAERGIKNVVGGMESAGGWGQGAQIRGFGETLLGLEFSAAVFSSGGERVYLIR